MNNTLLNYFGSSENNKRKLTATESSAVNKKVVEVKVSTETSTVAAVSVLAGPSENNFPDVWNFPQWEEKRKKYPWIICEKGKVGCEVCRTTKYLLPNGVSGVEISKEWTSCQIDAGKSEKRSTQLTVLRNKIKKHADSVSHAQATKIEEKSKKNVFENKISEMHATLHQSTVRVFKTAYYLAKNNRPFSDHEGLIELQKVNDLDLGIILHSRLSAKNIIDHVAAEMRTRIIKNVVNSKSKLSVLIDESTTTSTKPALIIYIKATVDNSSPTFIFLDLVELESQTANSITCVLLKTLDKHGFSEEYLRECWVNFVSDGASVMLGRKNGVAKLLKEKYPLLFNWHCLNHRLELAIQDAVKQISDVNHFKSFIDTVYALYNQSTKNKCELKAICCELDSQFLKVGRVLDTRWVSSSFRSVQAIWKSFVALSSHFKKSSEDILRDSKTRSKFSGLYKKMCSVEFVEDLALMNDVLQELSFLSKELQKRDISLWLANSKIKSTVRILESFKTNPGEYLNLVKDIEEDMSFFGVQLTKSVKHKRIKKDLFLESILKSMKERLNDYENKVLLDLKIFDKLFWPTVFDIRFGEKKITSVAKRFNLNTRNAVLGMRDFLEHNGVSDEFSEMYNCVNILSCSTAECERGFSAMNLICTDLRSSLTVENIANLMFVKLNGPPLAIWQPSPYVKSWLLKHRAADDNQSKKMKCNKKDQFKDNSLWKLL